MANETNNLQIVIEAVNKASAQLTQVEKDLAGLTKLVKDTGKSTKDMGTGAKSAGLGLKDMAIAVGLGFTAAQLARKAFVELKQAFTDVLKAATDTEVEWVRIEQLLLNLSKVIGTPFSSLKKSAEDAGAAGLKMGYDFDTSAESFARFASVTGSVKEANQWLAIALDASAQKGIGLDDATTTMIRTLQGGQKELINWGIDLDEDATKTEILAALTAKFGGVALKMATTNQKEWDKYHSTVKQLQETLGEPIKNVSTQMAKDLTAFIERMAAYLPTIREGLGDMGAKLKIAYDWVKMTLLGWEAILSTIIAIAGGINNLVAGNMKGAKAIKDAWEIEMGNISLAINETWDDLKNGAKKSTDIAKENLDDLAATVQQQSQKEKEARESVAKAYEKYIHDIEKTNKEYEKSLDALLIAHRDAWKQIKKDIKTENTDFKNSMEDMKKDFDNSMKDIEQSHSDKTKSILADMEDERRAAQDEIEDINEKWNSLTGLTQTAGQDRLANLQAQLDKELALGSNADQEKVTSLQDMIANMNVALEKALATQGATRDEEIADVTQTTDDKLAILQTELDEEGFAFQEALADRQVQYDEDVANAKDAHDKKIKDLQTSLDEENAIRKKYAKDFKAIGDQIALDDITTLKNTHNEQLKEMKYQYEQATAEFTEYLNGLNKATVASNKTATKELEKVAKEQYEIKQKYEYGGSSSMGSSALDNYLWLRNIPGFENFENGGLVTQPSIVGEKGYPEVVLPLNEPQRMAEILKGLGISGGGGGQVVQNFTVTVNNQADVDMVMERALFKARYQK